MKFSALSISRLTEWHSCPLKYAFKHHDKIPEDPNKDMTAIGVGHVVHRCYAMTAVSGKPPETFLKESLGEYSSEMSAAPPKTMDRIRNMLGSWKVIEPLAKGDEVYSELPFWLNACADGSVVFHGVIDLCVRRNNFFMVIDHKCKRPFMQPKDFEIRRDGQLCLYAIAVSALFCVPIANVKTAMFFPENSRLVTASWTSEQATNWLDYEMRTASRIASTPREAVVPTPSKESCKYCAYKRFCSLAC